MAGGDHDKSSFKEGAEALEAKASVKWVQKRTCECGWEWGEKRGRFRQQLQQFQEVLLKNRSRDLWKHGE